jgi:hypothetical protein
MEGTGGGRDGGRREEQERAADGAAERGDEPGEHRFAADEEVADCRWPHGDGARAEARAQERNALDHLPERAVDDRAPALEQLRALASAHARERAGAPSAT